MSNPAPGHTLAARGVPRATAVESARVAVQILAPLVARGLIIRRPGPVALSARWDLDARAVRLLQHLRDRHGDGPLRLRVPGRAVAVVLGPADVHRILRDCPEPFTPATKEKRAALGHFEPHGLLISSAARRPNR